MYSFIRELIYPFLTPMGLYTWSMILAILLRRSFRRFAFCLCLVSTLTLLILSTKLVGQTLFSRLEQTHPPVAIDSLEKADYIVLLGGSIGKPESPRVTLEFGMIGDRVLHAKRLYAAGKAPEIIVVGGNALPSHGLLSEAYYLAELLKEQGVPASDLILEASSRDTRENAVFTAALFDRPFDIDIILVTSAFHMPRALKLFEAAGFASVTPGTADILIRDRKGPLWTRLIPSSTGLALSSNAIHNLIGDLVNRYTRAVK